MNLLNCVSVSFTYSLILLGLSEKNNQIKVFLRVFLICVVTYLCFVLLSAEAFTIFPLTLTSAFVNKSRKAKYLFSLFKSLSAMMVYTLYVLIIGNVFFIFFPDFMQMRFYDIFMPLMSVLFSALVYWIAGKNDILKYFYDNNKAVITCVIVETTIIIFISFILPLALVSENSNYIYFSYYFLFAVAIIFVFYLAYYLTIAETKIKSIEKSRKYDEINNKIIEEKYNDIIRLKHYYNKLYQTTSSFIINEDLQGLKSYYDKYITPLHKTHIDSSFNTLQLALINISLIKNLLFDAVVRAEHIYNVQIYIDIADMIESVFISEMDLFIILNEWITNAFHAVENKQGFIHIVFSNNNDIVMIKVMNPVYEEIDIGSVNNLGYTTKQGHSGIGLDITNKIISSYENMEHMTYLELDKFVQCLIIRRTRQ